MIRWDIFTPIQGLRRDQKSGGGGQTLPWIHEFTTAQELIKLMQGNFIAQLNELGILKRIKNIFNKIQKGISYKKVGAMAPGPPSSEALLLASNSFSRFLGFWDAYLRWIYFIKLRVESQSQVERIYLMGNVILKVESISDSQKKGNWGCLVNWYCQQLLILANIACIWKFEAVLLLSSIVKDKAKTHGQY